MRSVGLFWRAMKSTRHELWVSIQVLVAVTIVLSLILYLVEHHAQPETFRNYWDALLWSFMGYIEDPGEFATYTPITFWGRVLKIACAIVNIAIFAVPAGLIAGGFSDAIADDKRERELEEYRSRLLKAFHRKQDRYTKYRVVPRYVSPVDVQALQEIDTKDIIDAVRNSDSFRLRNLASAIPSSRYPQDRLVIETIPTEGRTNYGCYFDRGSNVTIACPTSVSEAGIGNFAYHLALIGGFNFISKEIEPDVDEPVSFYLISDAVKSAERDMYLSDLKALAAGKDKWVIFVISSERDYESSLHFITRANAKTGRESTVIDREGFDKLFAEVDRSLNEEFALKSEADTDYLPSGPANSAVRIGGGETVNAFTIRVASTFVVWDPRYIAVCRQLAAAINATIGTSPNIPADAELKIKGFGYQGATPANVD